MLGYFGLCQLHTIRRHRGSKMIRYFKVALPMLVMTLLAASFAERVLAADRFTGRSFVTRSPAVGRNGMAATSQPLATLAAIEILQSGGNAIDAAIAANAVLAVTEPMSCGLGGDLFAIIWDAKSKQLYGLNAS